MMESFIGLIEDYFGSEIAFIRFLAVVMIANGAVVFLILLRHVQMNVMEIVRSAMLVTILWNNAIYK